MRTQPILILFVSLVLIIAGCSIEPATLESLKDAVHSVSATAPPAHLDAEQSSTDAPFEPLHPARVDPFAFPANAPVSDQTGTTITTVAQVEILGFAHVREPRVILRTRDTTRSLKVGEFADGVEVVAINAPMVELRMGTLVWTASMFDSTSVGKN